LFKNCQFYANIDSAGLCNQQKRKNNYDLNSLDFMRLSVHLHVCACASVHTRVAPFYFCTFHKNIPPDSFCCWHLIFGRLSCKLSILDSIRIKSFMLIFDHRICPESLSVEFGSTLYIVVYLYCTILLPLCCS
jgi:hypothetical protein